MDKSLEEQLNKDYDFFIEHYEEQFRNVEEALKELKRLHEMYEHEFDIKEIGDRI